MLGFKLIHGSIRGPWIKWAPFFNLLMDMSGLILGFNPANESLRYKWSNAISHWLGTNLESALYVHHQVALMC